MLALVRVEIRARRPYRLLDRHTYNLEDHLLLEVLILSPSKFPFQRMACIFTGKTGIYSGAEEVLMTQLDVLQRGNPAAVCDKTAAKLAALIRERS